MKHVTSSNFPAIAPLAHIFVTCHILYVL